MDRLNQLEKYYFERIKKIIEKNGLSFISNMTSQFNFSGISSSFKGKSEITDVMERVVQSIISQNTDWGIFSLATSSDSSFYTPKAVIHIDCKAVLESDNDVTNKLIDARKNQTSYATTNNITYDNIPFKSNLPSSYTHNVYGNLYTLTYFVRLVYKLSPAKDSFETFKVYLASIPNGLLFPILQDSFIQAGKNKERPIMNEIESAVYTGILARLNTSEQNLFNMSYYYNLTSDNYILCERLLEPKNRSAEQKQRKELKELYKKEDINLQWDTLRFSFTALPVDGTTYKWNRYEELDLK